MASTYHNSRKKDKPSTKNIKIEEKSPIEEAIRECENALSSLKRYLYTDLNSSSLASSVLKADEKFTTLKYYMQQVGYPSDRSVLKYGHEIDANLEKLKRTISLYNGLEGFPSKFMFGAATALLGSLIGCYVGNTTAGDYVALGHSVNETVVGATVAFGLFGGMMGCIIMAITEKNPLMYFVQKSHYSPIENITRYSDIFFQDVREKLKWIEPLT